jgi:hypothetical protein
MQKYSGRTISLAPCSTAIAIKRSASVRFELTFGPEAICIPATLTIPAELSLWSTLLLEAILSDALLYGFDILFLLVIGIV